MTERSIMLIGGPDSGKTNYLARFWEAIRHGEDELVFVGATDIKFLEEMVAHLLQAEFAPRSNKSIEESREEVVVTICPKGSSAEVELIVPDVTGELWKRAVADSELPVIWMKSLEAATGCLLFVRVLSDQNVQPLDWVTARNILRLAGNEEAAEVATPTQVFVSELLRILELKLGPRADGSLPRVSLLITAWDRLDNQQRNSTPLSFLEKQYPLLAGRLKNIEGLEVRLFGVSIVGGDLTLDEEFKKQYQKGDLATSGYVVFDQNGVATESKDLTLPVKWLLEQ